MTEDEKEEAVERIQLLRDNLCIKLQRLETQYAHLTTKIESAGTQVENLGRALGGQSLKEEPVNWRMVPTHGFKEAMRQWLISEEE